MISPLDSPNDGGRTVRPGKMCGRRYAFATALSNRKTLGLFVLRFARRVGEQEVRDER